MASTQAHSTVSTPRKAATGKRRVSLKYYLEKEAQSDEKLEYHNGKIIPMAGGTLTHNIIAGKVITALNTFIDQEELPYLVAGSDMKIRVGDTATHIVFPDAVVICEKPEYYEGRKDIITNPLLIVEVLSPRTEEYDRTDKFSLYRTLPSFKEYVLLSQEKVQATVYTRQDENTWVMRDYIGPEAVPVLYALHQCTLDFAKLYRGLEVG